MSIALSIIVPVYNRPDEMVELLDSLVQQNDKNFEVVIVEDGSTISSEKVVDSFKQNLKIQYFTKPNTGPGQSRNYGCERAAGNYFLFVDSDCILPKDYTQKVLVGLNQFQYDCFGGPDDAHESFSNLQKAVNYAMTSFFTTGGIRGGNIDPDKFQPRSFNMGFSKAVFTALGGFPEAQFSRSKAAGEDIELSMKIREAGYKVGLIKDAVVYHKRRTSWEQFAKQTYGFGYARVTIWQRNAGGLKPVHLLPLFFLGYLLSLFVLPFLLGFWAFLPLFLFAILIISDSFFIFKSLTISLLSLQASVVQLAGYGLGMFNGFWDLMMMGKKKFLGQYGKG